MLGLRHSPKEMAYRVIMRTEHVWWHVQSLKCYFKNPYFGIVVIYQDFNLDFLIIKLSYCSCNYLLYIHMKFSFNLCVVKLQLVVNCINRVSFCLYSCDNTQDLDSTNWIGMRVLQKKQTSVVYFTNRFSSCPIRCPIQICQSY